MDDPPPLTQRATEEFSFDAGSGSDTSESSAHAIAPGKLSHQLVMKSQNDTTSQLRTFLVQMTLLQISLLYLA